MPGDHLLVERSDFDRLPEDSHDEISHMARQFEKNPSTVLCQLAAGGLVNHLAHHRVHFKHITQPALLQKLPQQNHSRVVAIHISHLDQQFLTVGIGQDSPILRQRLPRRLVEVDVFACIHACLGSVEQTSDLGLNQHQFQAGQVQQLLLRQPGKIAVGGILLGRCSGSGIGFANPQHFELGRFSEDRQLRGMGVSGPQLSGADGLPYRSGERSRKGRRPSWADHSRCGYGRCEKPTTIGHARLRSN